MSQKYRHLGGGLEIYNFLSAYPWDATYQIWYRFGGRGDRGREKEQVSFLESMLIIPPWTKFRVYKEITPSFRPSVCPSVCADSSPAHNCFLVWHWLTIFGTWVYHHETMCCVYSWSRYDLEVWPKGQIYMVFDWFRVQFITFFDWQLLTIYGTWVYHHTTMCRVHPWSRFDVDLLPQGQIYRLLSCLLVRPLTFVSFDIGIPCLAHGSITIRGGVKYIHDPDMTLNCDLKVKFIGSMTWLLFRPQLFCPLT